MIIDIFIDMNLHENICRIRQLILFEQSDTMMDRRANSSLNAIGVRSDKDFKTVDKVITAANTNSVDPHTVAMILGIGTAFIPVLGPFIAAGIGLLDAGLYYKQGDTKTAGMVAMFSFMPGIGAIVGKIPGIKQLGTKGMTALAIKLSKGQKITDPVEIAVVKGISESPDLIKNSLNTQVKSLSQQAVTKPLQVNVKNSLLNLGKSGLIWTAKNVVPFVGAEVGYEHIWNKFSPEQSIDFSNINSQQIGKNNQAAATQIQF